MIDDSLCVNAAWAKAELAKERAKEKDPFHPIRRSKGQKHKSKRLRK